MSRCSFHADFLCWLRTLYALTCPCPYSVTTFLFVCECGCYSFEEIFAAEVLRRFGRRYILSLECILSMIWITSDGATFLIEKCCWSREWENPKVVGVLRLLFMWFFMASHHHFSDSTLIVFLSQNVLRVFLRDSLLSLMHNLQERRMSWMRRRPVLRHFIRASKTRRWRKEPLSLSYAYVVRVFIFFCRSNSLHVVFNILRFMSCLLFYAIPMRWVTHIQILHPCLPFNE